MDKKTKNRTVRFLGTMFLATLLIFIVVASAETQDPVTDGTTATEVASAGAFASATGSEVIVKTEVIITSTEASAKATARAMAENGDTATAIVEAWARWIDGSSAFARAVSTVVAGIGQIAWAEAYACASASEDDASAYAESKVVDQENSNDVENGDDQESGGDSTDNNPVGTNTVKIPKPKLEALSGFIFGGSDIERYCTFKLHTEDNDPDNDERATYYMKIIAWEYGYTTEEFENKYKLTCKN